MPHKPGSPLARVGHFDPEKAEPAIALGVDFASVKHKPLGDGRLHLGHGPRGLAVNVGGATVAAMHDEGPLVHTGLRRLDEIQVMRPSGPGRVDVSVGMKDGFEVLPFTRVSGTLKSATDPQQPKKDVQAKKRGC